MDILETFLNERGLRIPKGLAEVYASPEARSLDPYIYWPTASAEHTNSLSWALELLDDGVSAPPTAYLPLLPVDDLSIACAVCQPLDGADEACIVVRWHLGDIDPRFQGALLDNDVGGFVRSVAEELRARPVGLRDMARVARRYHADYVDKGIRPRGNVLRPVQLACQNVIIGMATLRHDAAFDGLRVPTYLTCEVPHVGTHEANRAMAALILCDAFQNGGTMEIRFGGRYKEDFVPPGLRRFGRSVGVLLGTEDSHCISPRESRDLFWAVTPMPADLRARCEDIVDRGIISPERLCYTLMASVWSPIELDYIIATSSRVKSILHGGGVPECRRARLAEVETCRAAVMLGMLRRHQDNTDAAGRAAGSIRVFEDGIPRIAWSVHGDLGAVAFWGVSPGRLPWASQELEAAPSVGNSECLICVPRGLPTPADHDLVRDLQTEFPGDTVALLAPADMLETVPDDVPVMACPDRIAQLDWDIERRLTELRVGRL